MISTVGSFVLAAGVLVTVFNVFGSIRKGRPAGPDPWRANTLEWFTPSPPPEHNFDVIPTVRSLEPMKDIRRSMQEREAALGRGHGNGDGAGHRAARASSRNRCERRDRPRQRVASAGSRT